MWSVQAEYVSGWGKSTKANPKIMRYPAEPIARRRGQSFGCWKCDIWWLRRTTTARFAHSGDSSPAQPQFCPTFRDLGWGCGGEPPMPQLVAPESSGQADPPILLSNAFRCWYDRLCSSSVRFDSTAETNLITGQQRLTLMRYTTRQDIRTQL